MLEVTLFYDFLTSKTDYLIQSLIGPPLRGTWPRHKKSSQEYVSDTSYLNYFPQGEMPDSMMINRFTPTFYFKDTPVQVWSADRPVCIDEADNLIVLN